MLANGAEKMGRIVVEVQLVNHRDVVLSEDGQLPAASVRKATIKGIVDTGAAHLVIPQSAVDILGVPELGKASVRYADLRREMRSVVKDVGVILNGRQATFNAIVEPSRTDALIGAVVLESLDLIVDCARQTLSPRDPEHIVSEIE